MSNFNSNNHGQTEPALQVVPRQIDLATLQEGIVDPAAQAAELLALHNSGMGINFSMTKELALQCVDEILEHWLPDGERRGLQYVALNPLRNDSELGSFQIKTDTGIWSDFASGDKGGDLISLIHYVGDYEFQAQAAVKILELIAGQQVDAAVRQAKQEAKAKAKATDQFTAIMPIPSDAKNKPIFFGHELGTPSMTWEYRNANGQVMSYVNRFETAKGKTTRPLTYCEDSSGKLDWKLKAPPSPRPAYGLDRLAARPGAPVLFTEGEKAADAAQRLFLDFVAVTTMNGAQSPEKTDFSPFAGRKVYIAPDNDIAGAAYRDKLIGLLTAAGAEVAGVLNLGPFARVDGILEQGYDLADAEAEGWTTEKLLAIGDGLWDLFAKVDPLPATTPSRTAPAPTEAQKGQTTSGKKSVMERANDFCLSNYGGNLAYFNNQLLAYKDGYWPPLNPDVDVKFPLMQVLGDRASPSSINSIYELVKIRSAKQPESFERTSSLICMSNGTLNPLTGDLGPHAAYHHLTNQVDITFDSRATCPVWLQTLDEIFAPDADKDEKIQLLQEYIGYCLVPDTRIHKFLWMVGAGANGKSLIIAVVTALVGKQNISYAQIERLQEKFVRAELQGKLVNISSEMSALATVADGYLKQITAGDIIEAERKHERPFSFKPYARLIGATNTLPRLLDHSDGFFRRAMILRFNRQFLGTEQDIHREAKLMAELPGILNWAVAGLQNLFQRDRFVQPASSSLEVDQYRVHSDPVRQFADDFLTPTEDRRLMVSSSSLYSQYKEWSETNGYKMLAINQFSERLVGVGFEKGRDKQERYWKAECREYCRAPVATEVSISAQSKKYIV